MCWVDPTGVGPSWPGEGRVHMKPSSGAGPLLSPLPEHPGLERSFLWLALISEQGQWSLTRWG